jgi:uncharacterized integral membrane protein
MYRIFMRYLKTAFVILLLFIIIIFCVHNTDSFNLSFLGYHLIMPLQLWMLLLIFFIAGMMPIFLMEFPRMVLHYKKMHSLKTKIAQMEKQLADLPSSSPKETE